MATMVHLLPAMGCLSRVADQKGRADPALPTWSASVDSRVGAKYKRTIASRRCVPLHRGMTEVERLAEFAVRASYDDLSEEVRDQLKSASLTR
jgi:hypothetical protein